MKRAQWAVIGLLFFAVTINYVDRAVIGVLKPMLDVKLGWDQEDYGWMVSAFQAAYAAGYLFSGRLIDRIGARRGLIVAVGVWSFASLAHAAAHTVLEFSAARCLLGLAEGGCFPAAIKIVSEWFPEKDRAFATGWFNAGSCIGAIVCPLLVPWMADRWGWQGAFVATGALGFVWVAVWSLLYRTLTGAAEAVAGNGTRTKPEPGTKIPWRRLVRQRQTWAFSAGMMTASPIWWFYIYWAPDFLNKRFLLNLDQSSLPLMTIFLVSSIGGIAGGWLAMRLIAGGWSVNAARKTALLASALCVLPVFATPFVPDLWTAVALISLAAAGHCGFSANLFTLVSDTVPRPAIASVVGIGGMAGSVAGIFFAQLVARVLQFTHNNYVAPFALAACAYLVGLGAIHLLLPRLERMPAAVLADAGPHMVST